MTVSGTRSRLNVWQALQNLVDTSKIVIDRPSGSAHPRFPELIYPYDYGYLAGTVSGDGVGIDCWVPGDGRNVVGLFLTVDPLKRDSEIKLLLGCSPEQIQTLSRWYDCQPQAALLVPCDGTPTVSNEPTNEAGAELWDILDVNGQPTGRTVRRNTEGGDPADNMRPGEYHRVVVACLFNPAGQMLIQQRTVNKTVGPNAWDLTAGGSALADETSQQAMARELAEEVGIHLDFTDQRPAINLAHPDAFFDIYLAEIPNADPASLALQAEEVQAVRWANQAEILALIEQGAFWPYPPSLIDLIFYLQLNSSDSFA